MNKNTIVKSGVAIVVAGALDRYLMGVEDIQRNAVFGAVSAGSLLVGTVVASKFSPAFKNLNSNSFVSEKTVAERAIEFTLSAGLAYSVNRFVFQNDYSPSDMTKRLEH